MGVKVGIDLGTTFSAVAWVNPQTGKPEVVRSDANSSRLITPSAIQFFKDGSYVCGAQAKEAFEDAEDGVTTGFKREMGTDTVCCIAPDGRSYTAEELSAILLRHLREHAEQAIGQTVDEAVITVPAYFEDIPRAATMRAARAAGLNVSRIISEPSAAALNYGLGHWRQNAKILVYDLGGGTFDVTLVGMGQDHMLYTIGTVGEHKRGGRDWDLRLANLAADKFREETGVNVWEDRDFLNELQSGSEQWKKILSEMSCVKVKRYINGYGNVQVEITREEFDEATKDLLEMTGELCRSMLEDPKLRLCWGDVTDILLVGGSTRMPQVPAFLRRLAGREPIAHVNPDQAVALGAAIAANMDSGQYNGSAAEVVWLDNRRTEELLVSLQGSVCGAERVELEEIGLRDAVAHAMGIILVNAEKTAYVNETVIPKFSPVPCKFSVASRFHTASREMHVYVVQGDGPLNTARLKAKYVVTGMRRVPGGWTTMYVQYSYDTNQKIHVQARQEGDTADLPVREEPFSETDYQKFLQPYQEEEQVQPLTAVLAIDVSGSMSGNPIDLAKRHAIKNFVDLLEGGDVRIGVIEVSDHAKWTIRPSRDFHKVRQAVRSITVGSTGYGNAADPFLQIDQELSGVPGVRFAVVLADGVWAHQPQAVARAKTCHSHGIDIAGIGFGNADKAFLEAISSRKDLSALTDLSHLGEAFGNIAQQLGGTSGQEASGGFGGLFGWGKRREETSRQSAQTWDLDVIDGF